MLPYGQRERVLKAMNKMEPEGNIAYISSSVWVTPIVMVMKIDGQTLGICGDYHLTVNHRLRRYATTTMEPDDFMKCILGNR